MVNAPMYSAGDKIEIRSAVVQLISVAVVNDEPFPYLASDHLLHHTDMGIHPLFSRWIPELLIPLMDACADSVDFPRGGTRLLCGGWFHKLPRGKLLEGA